MKLTIPQQNIWNLQKYYDDTAIANQCGAIIYREKKDIELLKNAIAMVIHSQSGLRLRFTEEEEVSQYLADETELTIPVNNFSSSAELDAYATEQAGNPIGLTDRAMYRFEIFTIGEKTGILATLSHLISDAWTFSILANEVDKAYRICEGGEGLTLSGADYFDYIQAENAYFSSEKQEKDRLFWSEKYQNRPQETPIKLNTSSSDSIKAKRVTKILPASLTIQLEAFCKEYSLTPAVVFETALISYLYRLNTENDTVTIGVPVLNRSTLKEKKTAGMFISTMPLTVFVKEDMNVTELAKQIVKEHRDIFRHRKYPYSDILKSLREKQNFTGNLYDVMMSYQNAKTETVADTKWYSNGASEVPFVIHIDNRDEKDGYTINVDYQTTVFKEEKEVLYIIERLEYILNQIIENSTQTLKELCIVPQPELIQVLEKFNDTYIEYPREKCVHELFTEQAERTPDKTALVFEDKIFTYKQLDEMSASLAHFLREKGIKPNDIVPIISKRSWYVIVAMLGVLKAGGAYMPVSPDFPKDRMQYMFETANATMALTYGYQGNLEIDTLDLSKVDYTKNPSALENVNTPDDLCYIIFTSGSTGKPKGVSIRHFNAANYCMDSDNNVCHKIIQEGNHSIVSVTNIVFDIFVTESILALLNGITIYFANDEEVVSQKKLAELITKHSIDVIQTTPTKMKSYILDKQNLEYLQTLKIMILGGEALPFELYQELTEYTHAKIFNIYGPAETTVWSTNQEIQKHITIGKPIANTQIYITDKHQNLLPIGVAGELCIAGDGVGAGYLNRPDLTAEKFVPNPFATKENHHGKVMYHTGDLARWRTDGEIEYLGRIDTQVKIRGLRIELGEIESVMSSYPGIEMTAVTDKRDENGRQYLVGYYTSKVNIEEKDLRYFLSAKLPKYMVPNYFMHLDFMPMTASGKTERKSLPAPDFSKQTNRYTYVSPKTETEKQLAKIWSELLEVEQIGRDDDFFELGGDSLLAIHFVSKIANIFRVELSVKDVLENTTLEKISAVIDHSKPNYVAMEKHLTDRYELLPQQKAIYAACQKQPESLMYNMPAKIILPKQLNREHLKQSISQILNRHQSLKSYIITENSTFYAVFDENAEVTYEEYTDENTQDFVRPFDLSKAPLVRIGFTENYLLFDVHHIILDGHSLSVIVQEIVASYNGMILSEPKIDYSDYAMNFKEMDFTEHRAFFKNLLKCDFEPVLLPEKKTGQSAGGASAYFTIPKETMNTVRQSEKQFGITDTMFFLGVYGILLSKFTAKEEVLTSMVCANRIHTELTEVVGMFANTLPVCLFIEDNLEKYFRHVKQTVLEIYQYQELPFSYIADEIGLTDKNTINTLFVYQAEGDKTLELEGQTVHIESLDTHSSKFDLTMEVIPSDDECMIHFEYSLEKYDDLLMERLFESMLRIVSQLENTNISDIDILSKSENTQIFNTFNGEQFYYDQNISIGELIEQQAMKAPDKISLVFENQYFTYRQLAQMSDTVANILCEAGVKKGSTIPIIAHRSYYLIIAILGVLKSGCAYLPLDFSYPKERLEYILKEAESEYVLTYQYNVTFGEIHSIDLEQLDYRYPKPSFVPVEQNDICYVIYTSGSTGKPKGVRMPHRTLINLILRNVKYEIGDNISCTTTAAFDVFTQEVFTALLLGKTLYLSPDSLKSTPEHFYEFIQKNKIHSMFCTPSYFNYVMTKVSPDLKCSLKNIFFAGEELVLSEAATTWILQNEIRIINQYGPSETHVVTEKIYDLQNPKDRYSFFSGITIGKPIANTQIYILNKHQQLLPIGVAGELCIAGDGVGTGYLNRPDLTAEKFAQNPFATKENHHGNIIYKTGDLARWRTNGEIEYLGRIDTQVKIRGLRIELGEIENVMGSYPGIEITAVTDKRDEKGRQYLVGYYTSKESIEEKPLRNFLLEKLPKYMVPNYLIHLDSMPMTANGKLNRKSLPLPVFDSFGATEYIAPITEMQKTLCGILCRLFQTEHFGIEDDFFERGGDSLLAIEYTAAAHKQGIDFPLQKVFDYSTVRLLCEDIEKTSHKNVLYHVENFEKYASILNRNQIDKNFIPQKRGLGNILLTGATGFLGIHLLDQLMKMEEGKIYCLVRNTEKVSACKRLQDLLEYYFGKTYDNEIGKRIIPIVADIESKWLLEQIPSNIDTIIHTAANVKHYGSYEEFKRINVKGTEHVIEFAKKSHTRLIHISTIGVSGHDFSAKSTTEKTRKEKHFSETSFFIDQPLDNVYIHSKFEAERAVYDAMLEGLDAKVVRVGNLTNRASDYKFQPNYRENAFLTRVKALLEFGMFPDYLLPLYAEFSPIDLTAKGIVLIAEYAKEQTVFHLNSNRPLYFDRMMELLPTLGIPMQIVNATEFNRALEQTLQNTSMKYIYEALQNDMDEDGKLVYDSNIRIENEFTLWFMKQVGFEWNEIDVTYLKGYLEYFRDLGYLEV